MAITQAHCCRRVRSWRFCLAIRAIRWFACAAMVGTTACWNTISRSGVSDLSGRNPQIAELADGCLRLPTVRADKRFIAPKPGITVERCSLTAHYDSFPSGVVADLA